MVDSFEAVDGSCMIFKLLVELVCSVAELNECNITLRLGQDIGLRGIDFSM